MVVNYLKQGYSPEQIAGTLKTVNADYPSLQVSHETIYSAIYLMPRGELRTEVIGLGLVMPNEGLEHVVKIAADRSLRW